MTDDSLLAGVFKGLLLLGVLYVAIVRCLWEER